MGFNLEQFFKELERILNQEEDYPIAIIEEARKFVKKEKKYAEECGQI